MYVMTKHIHMLYLRKSYMPVHHRVFQEKSERVSRPSEHPPPVRGGEISKRLGGIVGCKDKTTSWHLIGFLLCIIIGALSKKPDHRMPSYNRALEVTRWENNETTTLGTRRLLWAGALIRMSGERLPKRVVFGNLEGVERAGWEEERVDRAKSGGLA